MLLFNANCSSAIYRQSSEVSLSLCRGHDVVKYLYLRTRSFSHVGLIGTNQIKGGIGACFF